MNSEMSTNPFVLVDVFPDIPLTGNPLAVFPEANRLDDRTMQALAREFNFFADREWLA